MDIAKLSIREMRAGEQHDVLNVARRAFQALEMLFVPAPKQAIVAEYEGNIVGGIVYRYVNSAGKKIAYIAEAFVDEQYHGLGVGRRLYAGAFQFLWAQGCDALTALVKDDNVASWKLFMDNGFQRVGSGELIAQLGMAGMLSQYFRTPWPFSIGMDFYMATRTDDVKGKRNGATQLAAFALTNILLMLPTWAYGLVTSPADLLRYATAYATVMLLFIGTRYLGTRFNAEQWRLRFNNGGSAITLLLSILGNAFLMNANWYPEKYANTREFRCHLMIPELIKWCAFALATLLVFTGNGYLMAVARMCSYYLLFMSIPIYPFEAYGAGRIYRCSKLIWLATVAVSIALLCFC